MLTISCIIATASLTGSRAVPPPRFVATVRLSVMAQFPRRRPESAPESGLANPTPIGRIGVLHIGLGIGAGGLRDAVVDQLHRRHFDDERFCLPCRVTRNRHSACRTGERSPVGIDRRSVHHPAGSDQVGTPERRFQTRAGHEPTQQTDPAYLRGQRRRSGTGRRIRRTITRRAPTHRATEQDQHGNRGATFQPRGRHNFANSHQE